MSPLPPGESLVKLAPAEFSQLTVQHPRLWWPNGYGKPELYTLKLTFRADNAASDVKEVNFGIREITYELSLYDSTGQLRRVEISPTAGDAAQPADCRCYSRGHETDTAWLGGFACARPANLLRR